MSKVQSIPIAVGALQGLTHPRQIDDKALLSIYSRYKNFPEPTTISYATVNDFCDGYDYLYPLATINQDLKDAQRPWIFKTLLSLVRPGGRLLEIGAGEPMVASLLARLGYEVWVVDPYDGSGNGPREYNQFCHDYPELKIVRSLFTDDIYGLPIKFDAIYSISVLEHVPIEQLAPLVSGIKKFLRVGGKSLHAVDHVCRGSGADFHLKHIYKLVELHGQSQSNLDRTLQKLTSDCETYYLSAESHNRWRGTLPYDQFPMRVCVSLYFCFDFNGKRCQDM
jgi:SAM-dependent methyltransferase